MSEQISDYLQRFIDIELSQIYTSLPGQIETYDPETKKASVKPLMKKKMADNTELDIPVIQDVSVLWPSTANAIIHFPLARGDKVLLLFSQRSLDNWQETGQSQVPDDPRKFDLTDAICIPGFYPISDPGKITTGTGLTIEFHDSIIELTDDGKILLNGGGQKVARENDPTLSNVGTDASFWGWGVRYNVFNTAWSALLTTLAAAGPVGISVYASAMAALLATLSTIPASQTGKVNDGSDNVEAGG